MTRRASPPRDDLQSDLRAIGLRATSARVAVLRELRGRTGPVSHPELARTLAGSGIDRATVYRNLLDLVRTGLARRTDVGDHVWRFETPRRKRGPAEHAHFLCSECGDVDCLVDVGVSLGRVRNAPRALRESRVEVLVKGLCDRCHP